MLCSFKGISSKGGEKEMRVFRDDAWLGCFLAMIFGAGVVLGGCRATIKYSYDHTADFSTYKSYSWTSAPFHEESLIEKNVRYYADQSLKDKGFVLTSNNPDFVVSIVCNTDYTHPYKVRLLNLYIYRAKGKELIWQGTAEGSLKADAASSDLAEAVKKILANFLPEKR
jgi:hypothetical protein